MRGMFRKRTRAVAWDGAAGALATDLWRSSEFGWRVEGGGGLGVGWLLHAGPLGRPLGAPHGAPLALLGGRLGGRLDRPLCRPLGGRFGFG